MTLNFPTSPSVNDTYTYNGTTFVWDGEKWDASTPFLVNSSNIVDGAVTPDKVAVDDYTFSAINGGPLSGMRNQIINGNFAISQRGTTWNNPSANSYFIDRWRFSSNFDGVLIEQVKDNNPIPGSDYHLEVSPIPAGITWMRQGIEIPTGSPGPFSNGSIWTVSFWSFNGAYSLSNVEFSDVVAGGNNTGAWDISAPTVLETLGSWQHISHTVTCNKTPFASNQCVRVEWELPGNTRGGLAQVMFEPGPVPTPLEVRSIGTELALCQRYYVDAGRIFAYVYRDPSTTRILSREINMRANPSSSITDTAGGPFSVGGSSSSTFWYATTSTATSGSGAYATVGLDAEL